MPEGEKSCTSFANNTDLPNRKFIKKNEQRRPTKRYANDIALLQTLAAVFKKQTVFLCVCSLRKE